MTITLPIRPKAKARPRFYNGHAVTPQETRDYEYAIAVEVGLLTDEPLEGAIRLNLTFGFKAKNGSGWHTKKPDLDNLIKAVCDACNGILWLDDRQIAEISARKIYGDSDFVQIFADEM